MKASKLELRLDELEVESFDTTPPKERRKEGTVYGLVTSVTACNTCLVTDCTCASCSCDVTCPATCSNSCGGTCQGETCELHCAQF